MLKNEIIINIGMCIIYNYRKYHISLIINKKNYILIKFFNMS